ncbi:MAG: acyltransferase family protein [Methylococcales bacterium]
MQPTKSKAYQRLDQLTSLRFFAAMMIVLHHSQHHLGIQGVPFNLGQGVSFFFVLSGFILTYVYPYFDSWQSIRQFLRARIARIWPAYIFAFLFAFWLVPFDWRTDTGLANILMLQAWLPMSKYYFSYNAASWSVSTEFFFYLAFPFLIFKWNRTWLIKIGLSILILIVLFCVSNEFDLPFYGDPAIESNGMWVTQHGLLFINPASRILEFIAGMVVATLLNERRRQFGFYRATTLEFSSIIVCALSIYFGSYFVGVAAVSVLGPAAGQWAIHSGSVFAFALLIWVIAKGGGVISRVLNLPVFVFLGEISYSLYLLHQTVLTVIDRSPLPKLYTGWFCWLIFFVAILVLSSLSWLFIEVPFRRLLNTRAIEHGPTLMKKIMNIDLSRHVAGRDIVSGLLRFIACGCVVYAGYIALRYASQSPLDAYSFRQTQTALTAYWFIQDGFRFAYETPVAGAPWSIPLEFPIYQVVVALISKSLHVPLEIVGRLTSFLFLILCLIPARSITNKLRLADSVFYIFTAILFSTPIYIYWGRTFMMETAAVFFAITAIKYFIDMITDGFSYRAFYLYLVFITLSILQKATTGLPVLAVFSLIHLAIEVRRAGSIKRFVFSDRLLLGIIYFTIPLAIGFAWTFYADYVKSFNKLGMQLTSAALSKWNWGSIEQRFSSDVYVDILWQRIFVTNLAGVFGVALLLLTLFSEFQPRSTIVILIAMLLGILPLLLFTNLHIVHSYYQTGNLIFLVYAVAVALGGFLGPALGSQVLIPCLALIVISNYTNFWTEYLPQTEMVFSKSNSRDYAIGAILKREVPSEKQFIAFGNDWSSTFSYMSQRKSFTVPGWFKSYGEIATHPENFIDESQLGAIVACSTTSPSITDLMIWSSSNRTWKIGEAFGCYIVTPEKSLKMAEPPKQVQCQGSIDIAEVVRREEAKIILFAGWTIMSGSGNIIPDDVFITLSKPGTRTGYLEVLKAHRPDVSDYLGIPNEVDAGFSRIIGADLPSGEYVVGITQSKGRRLEFCQFQKNLIVEENS